MIYLDNKHCWISTKQCYSNSYYPFAHYETTVVSSTTTATKYYFFGGQRVAMKVGTVLTYLHSDHLGSTVMETSNGLMTADQKYFAYGKQRDTNPVTTDHRFTGQKQDGSGMMYYSSRYYDSSIGTFISADTIVPSPNDSFSYNRYLYSRANPMNFVDPSGHCILQGLQGSDSKENQQCWQAATQISSLMQNDPDNPVFNGESQTHFVAYVAPNPLVTFSMLEGILDSYWTDFYASVGIYNDKYNPAPVPNTGPPVPDTIANLQKQYGNALVRCAKAVRGVCGVSFGGNVAAGGLGGGISTDLVVNQSAEYVAYFTVAVGPQLSIIPIDIWGESASLIIGPGATLDSFGGPSINAGGTFALGQGMSSNLAMGIADGPYAISGGYATGYVAEAHIYLSYSWSLYDSR